MDLFVSCGGCLQQFGIKTIDLSLLYMFYLKVQWKYNLVNLVDCSMQKVKSQLFQLEGTNENGTARIAS